MNLPKTGFARLRRVETSGISGRQFRGISEADIDQGAPQEL